MAAMYLTAGVVSHTHVVVLVECCACCCRLTSPFFLLSLLPLLLQVMVELGRTKSGRQVLASAMQLCPDTHLNSLSDVLALRGWLASAW
jgi:hypothetical protein